MHKIKFFIMIIISLSCFSFGATKNDNAAFAQDAPDYQLLDHLLHTSLPDDSSKKSDEHFFSFNYTDTPLIDIIDKFAHEKKVNIFYQAQDIVTKVTLVIPNLLTLAQAWTVIHTLLDMAGYTMYGSESLYTVAKKTPGLPGIPLRLFIGTPPEEIPSSREFITYIYYLSNLVVSNDENSEVFGILKTILPESAKIIADPSTNSFIIRSEAIAIKMVMEILARLNQTDFEEDIAYVNLNFVSPQLVADLFKEILTPNKNLNRYRLDAREKQQTSYFSPHIKIMPLDSLKQNIVILLGRKEAIERVKDFILKYIDVEPDSGDSILHVYKLQYLDAAPFAEVLKGIVSGGGNDAARQSTGSSKGSSTERFFEGVIIRADSQKDQVGDERVDAAAVAQVSGLTGKLYRYSGGNKLIVAARKDDWLALKKLIEQLDTPQPQVILEFLIADLSLEDTRLIASTFRNPREMATCPSSCMVNAQSAQATPVILDSTTNPSTLASDLLGQIGTNPVTEQPIYATDAFGAGSTAIAISEPTNGQTWGLIQIQQLFTDSKVVANPHIIVTNNKLAHLRAGDKRLVPDQTSGSQGGTTQINRKWLEALLDLQVTPRISSADTVNLNILIRIDRFKDQNVRLVGTDAGQAFNTVDTRHLYTNANVPNKSVLAVGGLTRIDFNNNRTGTPVLSKIPLFGYFFKNKNTLGKETNLGIFIMPTILPQKLSAGASMYTDQYIEKCKSHLQNIDLVDSPRDPITRFFFDTSTTVDPVEMLDNFVSVDEFKNNDVDHEFAFNESDKKLVSDVSLDDVKIVDSIDKKVKELTSGNTVQEDVQALFTDEAIDNATPVKKSWENVLAEYHQTQADELKSLLESDESKKHYNNNEFAAHEKSLIDESLEDIKNIDDSDSEQDLQALFTDKLIDSVAYTKKS